MEQDIITEHEKKDDEISLLNLLTTLLKHKKLIIGTTVLVAVCALLYTMGSLFLPV